jgi:hypothetical protein
MSLSIRIGIGAKSVATPIIPIPTGLTLTLISGGVKVDWTDNSGGTAQTEIWGRSDSGVSALLYTIAAGIVTKNDIIAPVDLRYYKLRAKNGANYSAFTAEVSIAMLGAELITNGGFTLWTGNTPNTWGVLGADGTHYVEDGGGTCRLVNPSNVNLRMYQSPCTALSTYRIRATLSGGGAGGSFKMTNWASSVQKTSLATSFDEIMLADDSYVMVLFQDLTTGYYIDNMSVKKVLFP